MDCDLQDLLALWLSDGGSAAPPFDGQPDHPPILAVRTKIEPETDLHGSSDYRRHLAGVLTGRALAAAWRRAHESAA